MSISLKLIWKKIISILYIIIVIKKVIIWNPILSLQKLVLVLAIFILMINNDKKVIKKSYIYYLI